MIPIFVTGQEGNLIFDGGPFGKVKKSIYFHAASSRSESEVSYLLAKRYREAIRGFMYRIHGDNWKHAEARYSPLFRAYFSDSVKEEVKKIY